MDWIITIDRIGDGESGRWIIDDDDDEPMHYHYRNWMDGIDDRGRSFQGFR